MKLTRRYFVSFTGEIFHNMCEFTLTEIVGAGLPISTAQKVTDTCKNGSDAEKQEKIFGFRTDTVIHVAEVVDTLNRKKRGKKTTYERELKKNLKKIIYDFLEKKTFTELYNLGVLPRAQVSKMRKHKETANYYMETIGKIADYLENESAK